MPVTRNDISNVTNKSINDVRHERRVEVNDVTVQPVAEVSNLSSLVSDCKQLISQHKNGKIISMFAIDVGSMISAIRPFGVYRHKETILVTSQYGVVFSSPDSEYNINSNDTVLSFIMTLIVNDTPDEIVAQFTEALEALHVDYTSGSNTLTY